MKHIYERNVAAGKRGEPPDKSDKSEVNHQRLICVPKVWQKWGPIREGRGVLSANGNSLWPRRSLLHSEVVTPVRIPLMSRLVPISLVSLFLACVASPAAFAGATLITIPEPSSLALLASGVGIVYVVRKLRRKK